MIEHDQRPYAVAFAVGPQPHGDRNVHEIFVAVLARIARRLRLAHCDHWSAGGGRCARITQGRRLITRSSRVSIVLRHVLILCSCSGCDQ